MHIPVGRSPENRRRLSKFGIVIVLHFLIMESVQAPPSTEQDLPSEDVLVSNFQANLALVIGVLSVIFLLTFITILYAKFCHHSSSTSNPNNQLVRSNSRFSGIDKKVIESLPLFKFSSLKGPRHGLECAVCLSRFEEIEVLRLLPKCQHAFHINCVDLWLEKHSSCPICRQKINENDLSFFTYSNSTSLRFPRRQSDLGEPSSNVDILVERVESQTYRGSSRFGSFRGVIRGEKEEEVPICESRENEGQVGGNAEIFVERIESQSQSQTHRGSSRFGSFSGVISGESEEEVPICEKRENKGHVGGGNVEIFDEKNESQSQSQTHRGSSRFASFRGLIKGEREVELPIHENVLNDGQVVDDYYNHRIMVSEVVLKNRWSNVTSSDLMYLNSEMVNATSSSRFSNMEKFDANSSKILNANDRRSVSEIVVHPRFIEHSTTDNRVIESTFVDPKIYDVERKRRLWLPIARRTLEWFGKREKRYPQAHNTSHSMNV